VDQPLIIATGQALALVTAMLQRAGIVTADEFAETLNLLSTSAGEPMSEEGQILGIWAKLISESGRDLDPNEPSA
jgi:hypothetical protein